MRARSLSLVRLGVVGFALALPSGGCGGGGGGLGSPPSPPLALTQFLPPAADVAGGAEVNVIGTGFESALPPHLVRIGGRLVAASLRSDTLLQVVVPAGDALGPVDTAVLTGSGIADLAAGFTYLPSPPAPPALVCLPVVGQAGTRVDLTLSNYPALLAPTVTFGGLSAVNVTLLGPAQVRVEVPAGLPGGVIVEVIVRDGATQVTNFGFFSQGLLNVGVLSINEFLPDPGSGLDSNRDGTASSAGDELVELVNHLGVAVDLTGWTLSDASAVRHTFPNPTTVPAGGSIVIFGSGNPTYFPARHATGHAQVASTGTLGLNNSADSVILRTPALLTIAQVNYASADVTSARSRNAVIDGQAQPVPSASADYVLHDTLVGAVGTISPGVRVSGAGF